MRRIKIPAKLGACRFCVRTALVGLAVAVGGYLLAALLLDSIVLVVVALVGVAGFGALCIAHGTAFVLRRLGWAYSVAPCCGELMERAERFQDLQSRRALLAKAVAVTGSVLLLDLATGAIGGRRAAQAHHDDDGETEILTGDEADALRAQLRGEDAYQTGFKILAGMGYAPKVAQQEAVVSRTSYPDGRVSTQVNLPFIAQGRIDRPATLVGVRDKEGRLLILGMTFTEGPTVVYAFDNYGATSGKTPQQIGAELEVSAAWHRRCIGPVCVNWCIVVCGALAGACGVGCTALCASVCPPCAPFCGIAGGICAGVCAGVCIPTCEGIRH